MMLSYHIESLIYKLDKNMKNLNRNQWIAVSLSLVFLGYLLFSGPLISLFNLSTEGLNVQVSAEGSVEVAEVVVGEGEEAAPGDTLTVHYVGALDDGSVFDSSVEREAPLTFTLGVGQVIRGWDEGLAGMRVGGTRLLKISPEYAYGGEEVGGIPANSTLIFQVELLDVEDSSSR
jgi:hypothetical protein